MKNSFNNKQGVLLLTVGMFALGLDAYVIAGLMPAMDATFHVGVSELGQTVTLFTLCYCFSAPVFSTFLAGSPLRRTILIAMGIFTLANALCALTPSFSGLLVARSIAGIGAGLFSPIATAAAVALGGKEQKGRILSFILGGMSIGVVIGVPVGLMIAHYSHWQNTFWFITLLGLLAMAGIYYRIPSINIAPPPTLKERIQLLINSQIAKVIGITILTSIASLGLYTYLAAVVAHGNTTVSIASYLWAWGIGGIIGSFSIGFFLDAQYNPKILTATILLLMALSMWLLPSMLDYPILNVLPIVLWGAMGWSSLAPQQHTLLSLQPHHSAPVIALNSSANYLGSAIGSALGGIALSSGLELPHLPYAAGSIALLACFGQLFIIKQGR